MFKEIDIRNFYFENGNGKRIDCQKVAGNLFLYNVSGLGYEENIEYQQIGNTFVQNSKKTVQNQIDGELEFYNMTYDEYSEFVDFIMQEDNLKLIYIPKKSIRTEYYREIDIIKLEKTEEDEFNVLTCPISMKCKTLWYEANKTIYTIEPKEQEIRWDFEWDSKFVDYDTRNLQYINNGHTEAPVEIEISGHVINPAISLYIEGELFQTIKFNVEIEEYEKLLYCTKENEFYIQKQKADGTKESLFTLDVISFENDNVIRLPRKKSCEIRLTADDEILNASICVYPQYKTV